MRFLVMGAGAIGSVVGGFLARAGHGVTLVGRPAHLDAIRATGLHITGIWGDHLVADLATFTSVEAAGEGPWDVALITVKSYDTQQAVCAIAPVVGPETLVCAYQNGLGNAEIIAETVGWHRTVGVRAIFGARITEPGTVDVTVIAAPTAVGAYDPGPPAERVRALAEAMNKAGLPTVYTEEIATVLWAKVAYNCALNPMSALLDVPYGRLLEFEDTRDVMESVVAELYDVAGQLGVALRPNTAVDYVRHLYEELIPPTAAHYASMREDFLHRRRTEIDALNGAICRYGKEVGVACPANRVLTRLVHGRERALGVW